MGKRVISFSLWGSKPTYMVGIFRNVDMAKTFYPDFECWVYLHVDTVPADIEEKLRTRDNVKIIHKTGDLSLVKPMMWRFESIDDPEVEINMSRDCDTKILLREKYAVNQWLASGKTFHIMRDHPKHNVYIMGGMFGTRKIPQIPSWKTEIDKCKQEGIYMYDQDFLRDCIYPLIRADSIIHTSFHSAIGENAIRFPIEYDAQYNFVGQYINENEEQNMDNVKELYEKYTKKAKKMRMIM